MGHYFMDKHIYSNTFAAMTRWTVPLIWAIKKLIKCQIVYSLDFLTSPLGLLILQTFTNNIPVFYHVTPSQPISVVETLPGPKYFRIT